MSSGEDATQPDDTMRERAPESSLKLWVLLRADRWVLAGAVLALVFCALAVAVVVDPVPIRDAVATGDPVETLFQAFLTAIITGVTLVVSINSLVLSQELGAVGDQRQRMEESLTFREDVAAELDAPVSPPEPSAFLGSLVSLSRSRAERFREAARAAGIGDDAADSVDDYVDELVTNADRVEDGLEGAQFGTFDVLMAALDFNYSWKIYEARRLEADLGDDLDADATAALDDLETALSYFGPAREHVKTLYFQWELIDLSRTMLYASVPALAVSIAGILTLDNVGSVPGATLGVSNLAWLTLLGTVVALAPFVVLLSYVLRIATVAKRTLAIGPFVLRETDRSADLDWDEQ